MSVRYRSVVMSALTSVQVVLVTFTVDKRNVYFKQDKFHNIEEDRS